MARLKYWIWLSCIGGVRPLVKYQLAAALGGPEKLFFASKEEMQTACGLMRPSEAERLADKSLETAARTIGRCGEKNITILTLQDADYPDRLRQIPDPPVVLYIAGRLPAVDELPLIAVVGTRKATAYGIRMAAKMGREITAGGGVVVSGLAAGCDGAAIQGALEAGGAPVGVLGTAVDQVYPKQNKWLFDELRTRGALVSEYAPGMRTFPSDFVARNRIITGLSLGVVVAEAPIRSGTRTTVEHALEQNRDLFAVPGNADAAVCAGCNDLLAQGAAVATCGADVLGTYEGRRELFSRPVSPIPIKKRLTSRRT
ncbi:MAG: DNA-processing protein DprA [Oscillospiraceae bacterium]|nr:DNA-processing protein DprA [Oscillospiraceae bacterium]